MIAVAYDCVEKMVYWTDITGPAISKASLTGGDIVPVVTKGTARVATEQKHLYMWLHFVLNLYERLQLVWFLCLITRVQEKLCPGLLCSSSGMVSFQLLSQELNYILKTKDQTVPVLGIEQPTPGTFW